MQTQPVTPARYRFSLGCGGLIILIGIAMLIFGVVFLRDANASQQWPTAEGTVENTRVTWERANRESSSTSNNNRRYYFMVTYSYVARDQRFSDNRYSLGSGPTASKYYSEESEARAAAQQKYPVGSSVTVYYNPANPAAAVLDPGANWGTYMPLVLGLFFALTGIGLIYVTMHQKKVQDETDSYSSSAPDY